MEFAFTEEQLMIRDTAETFLQETSTSEAIRTAMATELGYDKDAWVSFCQEMYWQATHIPEEFGGMGLSYVELVAMMEQMGRFLFCSPFFSSVCLGVNSLLVAATQEQKELFLPQIIEGKTATLAYTGPLAGQRAGVWNASAIEVSYTKSGEQYVLNGEYRYVVDGAAADILVLAAKGDEGVILFVTDANASGIEKTLLPTMDQTRKQASIVLNGLTLDASAVMKVDAAQALDEIIELANIALAAEQMGGAQQCLDMAVEYTKERVQFNRPVASFQSIKHKAADMMTRCEVARSGCYYAACVGEEYLAAARGEETEMAGELSEAASIAKSYCSDAYFKNAGECMQMHGGVGFTWEYDVHLHFKRAKASEHMLGNGAYHRERLAQILLDGQG